jgi:hypothetical protein
MKNDMSWKLTVRFIQFPQGSHSWNVYAHAFFDRVSNFAGLFFRTINGKQAIIHVSTYPRDEASSGGPAYSALP